MCIRDRVLVAVAVVIQPAHPAADEAVGIEPVDERDPGPRPCLLYTSDAADERSSVDLGGRRIIKKKKNENDHRMYQLQNKDKTM